MKGKTAITVRSISNSDIVIPVEEEISFDPYDFIVNGGTIKVKYSGEELKLWDDAIYATEPETPDDYLFLDAMANQIVLNSHFLLVASAEHPSDKIFYLNSDYPKDDSPSFLHKDIVIRRVFRFMAFDIAAKSGLTVFDVKKLNLKSYVMTQVNEDREVIGYPSYFQYLTSAVHHFSKICNPA